MHYSRIALAASPILFTSVSAWGSAIIKNSCADDVYLWSCGDQVGQMVTVPAGQSHPEKYYSKADGGGPSIKIGVKYSKGSQAGKIPGIHDQPAPAITQFEYTVGTPGPPSSAVFYDISNIDGYPFMLGGVKVTSSDGSVNVACPKGVQYCQAAYNAPKDDHATGSAPDHVDLTMELCSDAPGMTIGGSNAGQAGSGGSSNGGSSGGSNGGSPPVQQPSSSPSQPAAQSSQPSQKQNQPQSSGQPKVNAPEKLAVAQVNQAPSSTSTTPPPSITPSSSQDVVVVWNTVTAAPVVVTTVVPAPHQKRHGNAHQHVHQKINKKRHDNI